MTDRSRKELAPRDTISVLLPWLLLAFVASAFGNDTQPRGQDATRKHGTLRVATCQFPVGADIAANGNWIRKQMQDERV